MYFKWFFNQWNETDILTTKQALSPHYRDGHEASKYPL